MILLAAGYGYLAEKAVQTQSGSRSAPSFVLMAVMGCPLEPSSLEYTSTLHR
jgi:hypothetical protein